MLFIIEYNQEQTLCSESKFLRIALISSDQIVDLLDTFTNSFILNIIIPTNTIVLYIRYFRFQYIILTAHKQKLIKPIKAKLPAVTPVANLWNIEPHKA